MALGGFAQAEARKPNILVIWGDDIGQFNISAYNRGMMGYKTPNIDSIASEGAMFTDWYGQQSCTAGRAAFITGQSPIRTGLTKVGPARRARGHEGRRPDDRHAAASAQGYVTGQFGKNHLGDRDDMLPTAHGFDEFFGNLYHLNAEEEPENPDYPKDPEFKKKFGPRGVIHSFADGRITDTGPLTKKRMETIDEEVTVKALDFMERAAKSDKPFFLWWNSTRMHIFTHLKPESDGKTGLGIYADGMVEHDGHVGQVLAKLKELGLDENTIVMYSTDNGAETFTWPDGGTTMFRGEKNTQLGRRLPRADDDPLAGRHQAGHRDQRHRRARGHAADAGRRRGRHQRHGQNLLKGTHDRQAGPTRCTSTATTSARRCGARRRGRARSSSTGPTTAASPRCATATGRSPSSSRKRDGLRVWQEPFTVLRAPLVTNLRMDPFERAEHENAMGYQRWYMEHMFVIAPAGAYVGQWLQSFKEFPPRQKPGSFNLDRVMEAVTAGSKQ